VINEEFVDDSNDIIFAVKNCPKRVK